MKNDKEKISDKQLNFAPNESWAKELGKSMNNIQETKFPLELSSRRPLLIKNLIKNCYKYWN